MDNLEIWRKLSIAQNALGEVERELAKRVDLRDQLSARSRHVLALEGIDVGLASGRERLKSMTDWELLQLPYAGRKTVNEIRRFLERPGA